MQDKEHIVRLGKLLAVEQKRGCDDGAAEGGLERFLVEWQLAANGALAEPPVRAALALLADYGAQPAGERRARVGEALEGLRAMFRGEGERRPETRDPRPER